MPHAARAAEPRCRSVTDYLDAFAALDRHEFAALALTLGVILFARRRPRSRCCARARAPRSGLPRGRPKSTSCARSATAPTRCCISEPQVIVVWPAGADEPEITGDVSLVMRTPLPRRVLAFGTWLEPDKAQRSKSAVDALRAEGKGFSLIADHAAASPRRGRRPRHRRPRGAAHQGPDRRARASLPSSPPITSSCAATSIRSGGCSRRCPRRYGRATRPDGSPGSTPPMRAPSRRATAPMRSRAISKFSIPRRARARARARGRRVLRGAAAGDRRGHAPHPAGDRPRRRRAAAPASASTSPRSRRCARNSPA